MKRGAKRKTEKNAKKAEMDERRKIVAANIMAGSNYRTIAKALGVSPATICKDFKAIIAGWRKEQTEIIDDWVSLENARMETMINGLWEDATKGKHAAIDRILKIMERRAKLMGLDSPVKNEQVGEIILRIKRVQPDGDEIEGNRYFPEGITPQPTPDSE